MLADDRFVPAYLLDEKDARLGQLEEVLQEYLLLHAAGGEEQRPICWCAPCTRARHLLGLIKQKGMRNRIPPEAREQIKTLPPARVPA